MDTDKSQYLLGLNTDVFLEYVVHNAAVEVFDECKRKMYGDKEVTEKLNFCMIADMPRGMPWSVWKEGGERVDNG